MSRRPSKKDRSGPNPPDNRRRTERLDAPDSKSDSHDTTELERKQFRIRVLRVVFISLLLDLLSFTFILPLFPKLLEFYRSLDAKTNAANPDSPTVLSRLLDGINAYKNAFSRPISDQYDVVLLGGIIGSVFSLCQTIAAPVIGAVADRHGRRTALLCSMIGNIASVLLWVVAADFGTFFASRIVGGLSEGNVQLAQAIAADVSDENSRAVTMALIGACFSLAFTVGPSVGAALTRWQVVATNPFWTTAAVSLGLVSVETVYLFLYLPETKSTSDGSTRPNQKATRDTQTNKTETVDRTSSAKSESVASALHLVHFLYILCFSGIEFSLPFMTYDLFGFDSARNGRLLGLVGIVTFIMQAAVTRRASSLTVVRIGTASCTAAFFLLAVLESERTLWMAAGLLAVATGTVVTGLSSLSSLTAGEAGKGQGRALGKHRSWGQLGRALGPIMFCSLYWWAGRTNAYLVGGSGMAVVAVLVWTVLSSTDFPTPTEKTKTT